MKRAAIISLNKRIILKERNIRTMEAATLRNWLLSLGKFDSVDFVSTKSNDSAEDVIHYKDARTTQLDDYTDVFLHNDGENFFGGVISKHTIKQIKELCKFKGNVYYQYTDPNLKLVNMARVIYDRQVKGTKTTYNTDQRITTEEVEQFANINWRVLWCGKDYNAFHVNEYQKKVNVRLQCKVVMSKNFEFFRFMFTNRKVNLNGRTSTERPFDLVYYGNWRPKREVKLVKYLNNNHRKRIIGFDSEKLSLPNTEYLDYAYPEALAGLVNEALASIVVGDSSHDNNITTARFYENILFEVCSFIDLQYDPQRMLYKSEFLKSFMYVASGSELAEKIKVIRSDEVLFKKIINEQKNELIPEAPTSV